MTDEPGNKDAGGTLPALLAGIGVVLAAVYFLFPQALSLAFSRLFGASGSDLERTMAVAIYGIPAFFAVIGTFGAVAAILLWRQVKRNSKNQGNAAVSQTPFSRGVTLGLVTIIAGIFLFIVLCIWMYTSMG